MDRPKTFMNWSSGKDAAMALYILLMEQNYSVDLLLTTLNKKYNRVSMHGLHRSLLESQAKSIGIPLEILELEENPSMEDYDQLMTEKLGLLTDQGFTHSCFGDIFLEDLRAYREDMLSSIGLNAVFPLWKKDTRQLLLGFLDKGFKAIVVCCNERFLPKSFCGRIVDKDFLSDLPSTVDPCGENGEFHTFCFDGPIFSYPIHFSKGDIVRRTYPAPQTEDDSFQEDYGFWYCDLNLEP